MYLRERKRLGIDLGIFPLYPSLKAGVWQKEPASLSDTNAILRSTLIDSQIVPVQVASRATSHVFKTWLLAAEANWGMSKNMRRALGYHKDADGSSAVRTYARDSQSAPCMELIKMILQMKEGTFDPDKPPGEMWLDNVEVPTDVATDWESSAASESQDSNESAEVNSNDSSGDEQGFGKAVLVETIADDGKVRDGRKYLHSSGKVHAGRAGSFNVTFCNTQVSHCRLLAGGAFENEENDLVLCQNCFGRDPPRARKLMRKLGQPLNESDDEKFSHFEDLS